MSMSIRVSCAVAGVSGVRVVEMTGGAVFGGPPFTLLAFWDRELAGVLTGRHRERHAFKLVPLWKVHAS